MDSARKNHGDYRFTPVRSLYEIYHDKKKIPFDPNTGGLTLHISEPKFTRHTLW